MGLARSGQPVHKEIAMKTRRTSLAALATVASLGLAGCAGMSQQDKNTAIGAGVGAVGGSVLTGGSAVGTVGGAVVGGVVGHEVSKDKK
jgi:osmotically inducible lipoprotein OsmB